MKNCPILMKFGTLHQILNPVIVMWQKIEIFGIQDGGDRHLKIAFLAITHRTIIRFRRNFVCGSRTACWQRPHDKTASIRNSGWRLAAIFKIVKLPYSSENIVGFWQNLVYYSMYWTWWGFQKRYRRILDVISQSNRGLIDGWQNATREHTRNIKKFS